jgi:hypothetical protein
MYAGVFLWRNTPEFRPGSSFSEGHKPEQRSGTFSHDSNITTPPPLSQILGHSLRSATL